MKTLSHIYSDSDTLKHFIKSSMDEDVQDILVQIFSSIVDEERLLHVSTTVKSFLPNADVIGATSAGEIYGGEMLEEKILISVTLFESTRVSSALVDFSEKETFESVEKKLIFEDTKALIMFSDGLKSNAESILEYISSKYPDLIVAGGRAADLLKAEQTYVFDDKSCIDDGLVLASLSGKELIVNSDYMLNWSPIGKEMEVTSSEGNIVKTIDDLPIKKLYEKYLGPDVTKNLPMSVTEFPLLSMKNGVKIARAPIAVLEDESMLFAGNLHQGEKVQFSYGNVNDIKNSVYSNHEKFKEFPSESIFIYSCSGRKTLMGKELENEFKMLESLGSTNGFFTYGEYYHNKGANELLNITTTFLALSESKNIKRGKYESMSSQDDNRILNVLSHLSRVTVDEIGYKNKELERLTEMISRTVLYTTSDLEGNITSVSKALEDFTKLSKKDLLGKNHNIFRHEATPNSFYEKMWKQLNLNNKFIGEVHNRREDGSTYWMRVSIEPMYNESGEKIGYSSYREDITDKKKLEYVSSHDTLTQLYNRGEFVKRLNNYIKSAQRYDENFCFIIFDIDYFKKVNDSYGHKIGDEVLITLSSVLAANTRTDDFLARWGGEEFVILTKLTEIDKVKMYIEKLQKKIKEISFSTVPKITLSFGITLYQKGDNKDSILKRADEALYEAKENGRDRYEIKLG